MLLDSLAACLRCLPWSDNAAKFFFTLMESCSCCWARGEVVNPARLVVHLYQGTVIETHIDRFRGPSGRSGSAGGTGTVKLS
jgi:hypothetical protein